MATMKATVNFELRKSDDDRRLVFGWASIAENEDGTAVVDKQGDVISPEEIEKAAYEFVLTSRRAGEMHVRTDGVGKIVESMVFTREKMQKIGIPDGAMPVGWWVGFRVEDDDVWAKIKDGTYSMLSIGGRGVRHES